MGGASSLAGAENTVGNTMSGGAGQSADVKPDAAESPARYQKPATRVTRNGAKLGTRAERLAILQTAVSDYQESGGDVRLYYDAMRDILVIALPETGECATCGKWFSGNGNGCPRCSGNKIAVEE